MFELLQFTNSEHLNEKGYIDYSKLPNKLILEFPNTFAKFGITKKCSVGLYCQYAYMFMPILIVLNKIGCNISIYNKEVFEERKQMSFFDVNYVVTDQISQEMLYKEVPFFNNKVYVLKGDMENTHSQEGLISFYTSGVTGSSSKVVKKDSVLVAEAISIVSALNLSPNDKILCNAPVFHSFGQAFGCYAPAIVGARVKYLPSFELPTHILSELDREEYTVLISTPAYYKLLYDKLDRYESLKYKLSAGGKLSDEIINSGVRINNVYGSTETGAMCIQLFQNSNDSSSVGHEIPCVKIFVDATRKSMASNELCGNIMVKTPYCASEVCEGNTYIKYEEDIIKLNDLGYKDETGNLYIVGRCDNVININGEKVAIDEIETALNKLEYVVEYKVGKSRMQDGTEKLTAFVIVKNEETKYDIRRSLAAYLDNYKIPKDIRVLKELKRSEMGKILANQE